MELKVKYVKKNERSAFPGQLQTQDVTDRIVEVGQITSVKEMTQKAVESFLG